MDNWAPFTEKLLENLIFKNFPYLEELFAFEVVAFPNESKISDAIAIFLIIPFLLFEISVKYFKIDLANKDFPDPFSVEIEKFVIQLKKIKQVEKRKIDIINFCLDRCLYKRKAFQLPPEIIMVCDRLSFCRFLIALSATEKI